MVEQRTLTPHILVRVQVSQPNRTSRLLWMLCEKELLFYQTAGDILAEFI